MITFALFLLLPLGALLVAQRLVRRLGPKVSAALGALPDWRWAPLAAGAVTGLVILYLWGWTLSQTPIVHDEASYLLQAQTFAKLRWTMPSPPIPAFFEQFHVLVTPVFASKYPPGHGILLVPGIWLGAPGLMPTLFAVACGALLFALVRRVANGWVAVLTVLLWLGVRTNLMFRPTYFSETSSSMVWLLGWWALLEWRERGGERWLIAVAACVAFMGITRPLTAVAFALPIGVVVLRQVVRRRSWRALLKPALVALAIVAVMPLWSAKTIGSWKTTPYSLYSKVYFPFDVMGFGFDSTPAQRQLPPDMVKFRKAFGTMHAKYTADRAPAAFLDRWKVLTYEDAFARWRLPFAAFAVAGLALLGSAGWFAVASSLLLTLCYLSFAHPRDWTLYYLEITPLLPFLIATGLWGTWGMIAQRTAKIRPLIIRQQSAPAALAAVFVALLLLLPVRAEIVRQRRVLDLRRSYRLSFLNVVAKIPDKRAMIFIRYEPRHDVNYSLIANDADLAAARTWFVYDRGASKNKALAAAAPTRIPYLFDESSGTLMRLVPTQLSARTRGE
jgi:hypothetical protein